METPAKPEDRKPRTAIDDKSVSRTRQGRQCTCLSRVSKNADKKIDKQRWKMISNLLSGRKNSINFIMNGFVLSSSGDVSSFPFYIKLLSYWLCIVNSSTEFNFFQWLENKNENISERIKSGCKQEKDDRSCHPREEWSENVQSLQYLKRCLLRLRAEKPFGNFCRFFNHPTTAAVPTFWDSVFSPPIQTTVLFLPYTINLWAITWIKSDLNEGLPEDSALSTVRWPLPVGYHRNILPVYSC